MRTTGAPRELLEGLDQRTITRYRLGLGSAVLAQLVLVASTLVLADLVRVAFGGGSIAARLGLLVALIAARAALRDLSSRSLSDTSAAVRHRHRSMVAEDLIATIGTPRRGSTGEDTSLLGADVDALDDYVTRYRPARVAATIVPVVVVVIAGVLDPVSMAILLFAGPMLIALLALVGSRTRTLADRRLQELGWLRSFHLDMVRGIPTLRVFGRSREGASTIGEVSDRYARSTMDVLRTAFQTSLVIEWAATAATALVAVQVGLRLTGGHIGFGAAFAVLLLTPEFFAPLRSLAVEYHAGQTGAAALERLGAIEHATPTRGRVHSGLSGPDHMSTPPIDHAPSIVFDDVSISVPSSDRSVLDRATFSISAGESVALVGPSGIGKTTIAMTLLALHPLASGAIRVDGRSIADLDPEAWRRAITFVVQRPAMLSGTIADNIALSDRHASRGAIEAAAALAGVDEFAHRLEFGLDTAIGEGGLRLSGGQRQRIAIARAVLRPAPVVVLDEFTAHLDPRTEADLIDRIGPFLADRTTLLITHRGSTHGLADRILRLDDGALTEVRR